MDDGSDLAIISGSGKLPLLIKKLYKTYEFDAFVPTSWLGAGPLAKGVGG